MKNKSIPSGGNRPSLPRTPHVKLSRNFAALGMVTIMITGAAIYWLRDHDEKSADLEILSRAAEMQATSDEAWRVFDPTTQQEILREFLPDLVRECQSRPGRRAPRSAA